MATPMAAEHPRPPPGGRSASTSTARAPYDGDAERTDVEERPERAREVVVVLVLADRDVPAAHEQAARPVLERHGVRARAAVDADGDRRHAVHDGVLAEQDHLAARVSDTAHQLRLWVRATTALEAAPVPRRQRRPVEGDARLAALAPRFAPRCGAATPRSLQTNDGGSHLVVARVRAPEDATRALRPPRGRRLDDERRPLAGAEIVARRLAGGCGIAEDAEEVVAQLERDAERIGERARARRSRLSLRPRGARP